MKLGWIFIGFVLIVSCNPNQEKNKEKTENAVKLQIPELTVYPPTEKFIDQKKNNSKTKVYFSLNFSCSTCISKLQQWNNLKTKLKDENIKFYLIAHSEDDFKLMNYLYKSTNLRKNELPIYLDKEAFFFKRNYTLQKNGEFNTIVTDLNNQILFDKDIFISKENLKEFFKLIESKN